MVRFDEGDILLKEWSLDKPVSELLYQLEHDNVIGRLWAIGELQSHVDDLSVQSALKIASIQDDSEAVRKAALDVLSPEEGED